MKRILALTLTLFLAMTAMAYDFAGKTYQSVEEYNGKKMTLTVKFTSATRATMTMAATGQKTERVSFRYEVSGDVINAYFDNGDTGYFMIDSGRTYGEDCIYVVDDYGNEAVILKRVASAPASKSGTKKSKKRR